MNNQHQAVSVEFKDGRQLFGVWAPWIKTLATPLFSELGSARGVLDCGISRLVNIEEAKQSAEAW
jgi:hypothetical protein